MIAYVGTGVSTDFLASGFGLCEQEVEEYLVKLGCSVVDGRLDCRKSLNSLK
jgi:hypothetical protein